MKFTRNKDASTVELKTHECLPVEISTHYRWYNGKQNIPDNEQLVQWNHDSLVKELRMTLHFFGTYTQYGSLYDLFNYVAAGDKTFTIEAPTTLTGNSNSATIYPTTFDAEPRENYIEILLSGYL